MIQKIKTFLGQSFTVQGIHVTVAAVVVVAVLAYLIFFRK
jgi:hypothetical protein